MHRHAPPGDEDYVEQRDEAEVSNVSLQDLDEGGSNPVNHKNARTSQRSHAQSRGRTQVMSASNEALPENQISYAHDHAASAAHQYEPSPPCFDLLTDNLILRIFTQLDYEEELEPISRCCKRFNRLCNDPKLKRPTVVFWKRADSGLRRSQSLDSTRQQDPTAMEQTQAQAQTLVVAVAAAVAEESAEEPQYTFTLSSKMNMHDVFDIEERSKSVVTKLQFGTIEAETDVEVNDMWTCISETLAELEELTAGSIEIPPSLVWLMGDGGPLDRDDDASNRLSFDNIKFPRDVAVNTEQAKDGDPSRDMEHLRISQTEPKITFRNIRFPHLSHLSLYLSGDENTMHTFEPCQESFPTLKHLYIESRERHLRAFSDRNCTSLLHLTMKYCPNLSKIEICSRLLSLSVDCNNMWNQIFCPAASSSLSLSPPTSAAMYHPESITKLRLHSLVWPGHSSMQSCFQYLGRSMSGLRCLRLGLAKLEIHPQELIPTESSTAPASDDMYIMRVEIHHSLLECFDMYHMETIVSAVTERMDAEDTSEEIMHVPEGATTTSSSSSNSKSCYPRSKKRKEQQSSSGSNASSRMEDDYDEYQEAAGTHDMQANRRPGSAKGKRVHSDSLAIVSGGAGPASGSGAAKATATADFNLLAPAVAPAVTPRLCPVAPALLLAVALPWSPRLPTSPFLLLLSLLLSLLL